MISGKKWIADARAAVCGCGLYADALPDGWKAFFTGSAEEKAKCSVTAVKDGIKIVDASPAAEAGIGKAFPVAAGKYYRLTVRYAAAAPLRNVEITAYYSGKVRHRGGQAAVPASGTSAVITIGPVPDGATHVTFYFYSMKHQANTVTVQSAKFEESDKPFDKPVIAPVESREVYVAPDGDDKADGSKAKPWKTLEKAAQAGPGTTVIFKPGRYSGKLVPQHSGAADAPIVFRSAEPGKAVFTGGKGVEYAVVLKGCSNVEVDGFRFDVQPGNRWMLVQDAFFCTVRNCHMEHSTIANPIRCRNVHYSRFDNLQVFRCENRGTDGEVSGDMWNNENVSHTVYSRLYISRAGHRPMGLGRNCRNIVVRDSVFDCRWGRNFEYFSPKKILIERCFITNSYEGSGSYDGRAKLFTIDGIFRYNLIARNNTCPLVINAYRYYDHPPFGMMRSRLYFNTWFYNQDCAWQMVDMNRKDGKFMVTGNVIKNNIMVDNNPADGTALYIARNIAPDNRFVNNLLRGRKAGDTVVKTRRWPDPQLLLTAEEANKQFPQQYQRNFDDDPKFTDTEKDDYRLQAGSPAVDRAEPLTLVTEASKGIYLSVGDARYFYDGYGIPGEAGDTIVIGPEKKTARIVQNLAEDKMLILDRPVAVNKGDSVDLPYAGNAPDLGCFELGMKTGPQGSFAPYRIEKMDTATEPVIVCDFEENDVDRWFFYWNHTRKPNSSAVLDKTVGANGSKGSWKVYFRKNQYGKKTPGSMLSTHVVPSRWLIDRFPYVEFAYRIPKGVPVGVSVHESSLIADSADAPVLFLAGSPALDVKTKAVTYRRDEITLIDDGQWHKIKLDVRAIRKYFPNVKMLSIIRFWAPACNGKEGDAYWIDDFAILPAGK